MGWISSNNYLTEAQMQNNAALVYSFLSDRGWTANAIAGVLGNMESESNINPGLWQSLNEGNMSGGFGLVQWTPATNFTDWADDNGYSWGDGDAQLLWLDEQTVPFGQWIATSLYPMSFADFKISTQPAAYLASCFLKNFERAGVEVEDERRENARKWYEYITGEDLPEPDPDQPDPDQPDPDTPSSGGVIHFKKRKYKFYLFNRQKKRR